MNKPKRCLVCKQTFPEAHIFYSGLCQSCGDLNYAKRGQTADLRGAIALVTGARVKIGYAVALRLLRAGAQVIATTRFPRDAASRFAGEGDFKEWSDRLQVYALDLRHLPRVEAFARHVINCYPRLDIIINNAAQTIRRPPAFYEHLLSFESLPPEQLPSEIKGLLGRSPEKNIEVSQYLPAPVDNILPEKTESDRAYFPAGIYDEDDQQLDLRPFNSWLMKDDEVSVLELLEVHVINAIAPFVINSRLKTLMKRAENPKYIINVSSKEGQFNTGKKPWRHPHTNMAKAALNQMTRTCALEYAKHRIYMNAVDPGWISFEHPYHLVREMRDRGVRPPFDVVDGAARICDPIYLGVNEDRYLFGKLFKDYTESQW
ncbi:MAG: SDR family oxidoreductase, partial [Cyanobacteriota bacterium]|nr:SDR family oxidoreductase [Cyanobacteriota bacterium]